jgi:hypothetical protein
MQKIKVVYEWIGPRGPLSNNRIPNIHELANALHGLDINQRRANSPFLWKTFFERFPHMFELSSTCEIQENDVFVYDYQLHHRTPFEGFFSFGTQYGLLESIEMSYNALNGIKHGNGYLLLDMSLESFVNEQYFHMMHNYFTCHNIPLNKVIYQTGCPNADHIYFKYCERNNISINERINIICWDSFEWQLSQRHQTDEYTTRRHIDVIEKDFLSLNYRYRPHRLDLTLLFYKLGLLDHSYFSIPAYNPEVPIYSFTDSVDMSFCNKIGLTLGDVHTLQNSILPLRVDDLPTDKNNHSEITMGNRGNLIQFYDKSLISVVTETNAYMDAIAETEKTFKPIIFKQPFIIVGGAKSLHYLRNKGYKTFSNWFDESYDNITDHHQRLIAIGNLCVEIKNWSRDKKKQFIEETQEIVEYNYKHFQNVYSNRIDTFWTGLLNNA